MNDIIRLLPDSIANQIAAGEVVQRPSSVIKELVENAIDAGADNIEIRILDAGKTLVQVIDNGKGMTMTDARMAFERHATSKIKKTEDLFALYTMGFRGEALPSIASVAQVEIKTKLHDAEMGTCLKIEGGKVIEQYPEACANGTNIAVKNLFFNVPARRKFLKSNETEKKNIINEFERLILVYPDIEFSLYDGDIKTSHYPISSHKQRISNVFGKVMAQQLLAINVDTTIVKIQGFVVKPEGAKKTRVNQYFFVNGRYMRNPYFNSAVLSQYQQLIRPDEKPSYFIYLTVDPQTIDVNIHPTKTEVKFENEKPIWQILSVAVKESLGKFNEVPSIDFDQDALNIPIFDKSKADNLKPPKVSINPNYNPFSNNGAGGSGASSRFSENKYKHDIPDFDWEKMYDSLKKENNDEQDTEIQNPVLFQSVKNKAIISDKEEDKQIDSGVSFFQYKNKYIILSVKSGLMLIDQHRAHKTIMFDHFMKAIDSQKSVSQTVLFPETIELSTTEANFVNSIQNDLENMGMQLNNLGSGTYAITGVPPGLTDSNTKELLLEIINNGMIHESNSAKDAISKAIALSLSKAVAVSPGKKLSQEEMMNIVNKLFQLSQNQYTPEGKKIICILDDDFIAKQFK